MMDNPSRRGARGNRIDYPRQHDQEVDQDVRAHINNLWDARCHIDGHRFSRHEEEVCRRQEYEQEFGNPDAALQPLNAGNAADPDGDDPELEYMNA